MPCLISVVNNSQDGKNRQGTTSVKWHSGACQESWDPWKWEALFGSGVVMQKFTRFESCQGHTSDNCQGLKEPNTRLSDEGFLPMQGMSSILLLKLLSLAGEWRRTVNWLA